MKLQLKHIIIITAASFLFIAALSHAIIYQKWIPVTIHIVAIFSITIGSVFLYVFILELTVLIKDLLKLK